VTALLITVHVVACITLILVILLQAGRGADMGAAFGGASSPMFGSGSAANPLARITTITAVTFMTTALLLAVGSARRASVFDDVPEPLAAPPRAESVAPSDPEALAPTIPAAGSGQEVAPTAEAPAVPDNPVPAEEPSGEGLAPSDIAEPAAEADPSPAEAVQEQPLAAPEGAGDAVREDAPAQEVEPAAPVDREGGAP